MFRTTLSILFLVMRVQSQGCTSVAKFLPGFNSDISQCMKPTTGTTLPYATPFTISWDFSSVAACTTYANGFFGVPGLTSLFFGYAPCKDTTFTPYSSQTVTSVTGNLVTSIGPCPICTSALQQPSIDIYLAGNYNGTIYLLGGTNVNLTYSDAPPTKPANPINTAVVTRAPIATTAPFTATFPTTGPKPVASPVGSATSLSRNLIYTLNIIYLAMVLLGTSIF